MPRTPTPNIPVRLGFDEIERAFGRVTRTMSDGYPLYDVERIAASDGAVEVLRITLAVAGFARSQLDVLVEDGQLVIRGRQVEGKQRVYLHRGIAARQFQRVFLLADGMRVVSADLNDGLLRIDLHGVDRHGVDLHGPGPLRPGRVIDIDVRD